MNEALTDDALDQALAAARQRYIDGNPESRKAHHAATHVMPGGNTRTVLYNDPFPLRIVKGAGVRITDADGHDYLNLLGEYTAGLFGHTHPVIRAAIDGALDQGISLSGHNYHEIRLASLVCQRFPSIDRVRFTNSGTEANLMAVSTARYATGRSRVMVMNGGYHGGLLYFGNGGIPINAPFDFVVGRYNDSEHTRKLINDCGDDLACVLVEPMMGSAGCLPASSEFLTMLREACDATGALLIFDEVMTSRLAPGGAQGLHGIMPDLTTLGKYIGGGLSFGAFGGREALMSIYDPRTSPGLPHAGTFNNNTLTMAAGCAAMGKVFTPEAAIELNARGDRLREQLNGIITTAGFPGQFTGVGSLMNFHGTTAAIKGPEDLQASDERIKELVFLDLLERGYYIARRGFVALMLDVTDEAAGETAAAFEEIIQARGSLFA